MTTLDVAAPGLCGCGEYRSKPHACEERPGTLRLCECGEWTYSPTCLPCRRPEPLPMGPGTVDVPAQSCGCLLGDDCDCSRWIPPLLTGTALYGRRP